MTKKKFMQLVTERVKELSPKEDAQIYCDIFFKNNGTERYGVVVRFSGDEIVYPTIYIDSFYDGYIQKKQTIDDVAKHVWKMIEHIQENKEHYQDFSFEWDFCKNKIFYRLISQEMNEQLLKEIPYIPFLDLAIVFGMVCYHAEGGLESLTVNQSLADFWNVSASELFQSAEKNTPQIFPLQRRNLLELVFEYLEIPKEEVSTDFMNEYPPMQFVGNTVGLYGAGAILYPGYIDSLAEEFDSDLFVIPSSIHEMIVLPVNTPGIEENVNLPEIVKSINQNHVREDEILSEKVYLYNRAQRTYTIQTN